MTYMLKRKARGFTIVELLIAVVVIAILAAISTVAYTAIQNRANDAAVQNDISNFSKKIKLYYAEFGTYPGGGASGPVTGIGNFSLGQASYATNVSNFYYCRGRVNGERAFAVGAVSKSNNRYYYSSLNGSVQSYTGSWGGAFVNCTGMLPGLEGDLPSDWNRTYGYGTGGGWSSWTN